MLQHLEIGVRLLDHIGDVGHILERAGEPIEARHTGWLPLAKTGSSLASAARLACFVPESVSSKVTCRAALVRAAGCTAHGRHGRGGHSPSSWPIGPS